MKMLISKQFPTGVWPAHNLSEKNWQGLLSSGGFHWSPALSGSHVARGIYFRSIYANHTLKHCILAGHTGLDTGTDYISSYLDE